jgi:hypothetical protein
MSNVSPQSRFSPADDVVFRNLGDETVILSIGSGLYFGLTPEGSRIWELLDQGRSLGAILEILITEYDVSAHEAKRDLDRLISELTSRGLVTALAADSTEGP